MKDIAGSACIPRQRFIRAHNQALVRQVERARWGFTFEGRQATSAFCPLACRPRLRASSLSSASVNAWTSRSGGVASLSSPLARNALTTDPKDVPSLSRQRPDHASDTCRQGSAGTVNMNQISSTASSEISTARCGEGMASCVFSIGDARLRPGKSLSNMNQAWRHVAARSIRVPPHGAKAREALAQIAFGFSRSAGAAPFRSVKPPGPPGKSGRAGAGARWGPWTPACVRRSSSRGRRHRTPWPAPVP